MTKQASIPPAYTARPALDVLPPSTYSPGPCRPLHPRSTNLFLTYRPLPSRPPFAALNVTIAPVNPCGYSLRGYVLPPPFFRPLPPSTGLDRGPSPFRYQGGSCLQSWSPALLFRASSSPAHIPPCLLMSSGSSFLRMGALLRIFRGIGISTPWQSPATNLIPALPRRVSAVQSIQIHSLAIALHEQTFKP